jgi:uncharacterized protein
MRHARRILDADAHVIEPASLFGAGAAAAAILTSPNTPLVPCGDASRLADQFAHGFDAPSYLRAMDAQGIDAAVLYPSIGLFVPFQPAFDAAASAAACRTYNDWVADYCAIDSRRLAAVGVVPLADPHAAAAEATRIAQRGLVGALARPNFLYDRNLGDRAYDPLFDALARHGLVLAVHEGLGVRGPTLASERFSGFTLRHLCSHPMEQMAAMGSLMLDGALERHPTLRVAFLESGTGWLPYWLARLDQHRHWMRTTECAALSLAPSEYFARQCMISCDPEDTLVPATAAVVGPDHIVWASDFPHPDAVYPGAVDEFVAHAGLPGPSLDAVMWDNAVSFYPLRERFGER